jgi:nucleoside-diphosphate-sugar epimerase
VHIAEAQPSPPRWVQASSNAVFGARNPHRFTAPLRADEPMKASDLYSAHKIEAEQIVRASSLEWVVLRLGGVLSVDPSAMKFDTDALYFESALPATITCTAWMSATWPGRSPRLPPPMSSARSF